MICVKKEIETHNGLFRIGAVVLNEDETWKDDNVKSVVRTMTSCSISGRKEKGNSCRQEAFPQR